MTDAGRAYIKALGNRQGPHVLATDWVGTHLARWFGLSTFDIAIFRLDESDCFPLRRDRMAQPGPVFAARAVEGSTWGGNPDDLDTLVNPEDITRLVIFDTWLLNCDRHHPTDDRRPNYDNVFLQKEDVPLGKARLIAMDHGLCFIRTGELTAKVNEVGRVKDQQIYGMFPGFSDRLRADMIGTCVQRLGEVTRELPEEIISYIPPEWDVSATIGKALADLIYRRAGFVAANIEQWVERDYPWFGKAGATP